MPRASKKNRAAAIAARNKGVNLRELTKRLEALRNAGVVNPGYNLMTPFRSKGAAVLKPTRAARPMRKTP